MIRAVTFDVGGTLIYPWPSVGDVYCTVAAEYGYSNLLAAEVDQQFAKAWKSRSSFDYSRSAWAGLVRQTFEGLLEQPVEQGFFDALYCRFESAKVWRLYDDVWPALHNLRSQGIKLGIISNWDERLRTLLRELELEEFFDPIIISCEAGYAKPSRQIFERAIEALQLPVDSILHVGDSLEDDVRGAQRAGLSSAHLKREGARKAAGQIHSLMDATRLLQG
jgi:putative hydrolase of the HAD superfamily